MKIEFIQRMTLFRASKVAVVARGEEPTSSHSGFTLIEILIYSAVFSIIIIGFLSIFTAVTQIESRQAAESVVNQESQFLLSTIQRNVESASLVDIPENTATSTLTLRTTASSTDPTSIYLSGTTVYLRVTSSGVPQALTSPNVKVTSLSFTRRANPPGHDAVSANFTIAYYVTTTPQNVARSLEFAVARVSAATFDSSVIPSSTATYDLGVANQIWRSVNNILYFSGSNVGVGVANPGQAFEVNGGVRIYPTSVSQPACNSGNPRSTIWITQTSTVGVADSFQICSRQGDGTYAWMSVGGGTPAGSNGQVQFNSSTAFGADPNLFWDNTNKRLGIGTTTPMYTLDVVGTIRSTGGILSVANQVNFDNSQHATYLGNQAGGASTWSSTAVGYQALFSAISSCCGENTALGTQALYSNTTGGGNTAIGSTALYSNTIGANSTAVGDRALQHSTGTMNDAFGNSALYLNTSDNTNAAFGNSAMFNNLTGSNNVAIGQGALSSATSSDGNIAIGPSALNSALSGGVYNVGIGMHALQNLTTGVGNVAIGGNGVLGNNTTGNYNVAIGSIGGGDLGIMNANTIGSNNIGIGYWALRANTTGNTNYAIGDQALDNLNGGSHNIAIGHQAGNSEVTGTDNIFIGTNAGNFETGSNKLYIANSAGNNLIYGDFSAMRVGIGMITPAVALQVNGDVRVGTSGTNGCLQNFAGTPITGMTCVSDARLKTVTGSVSGILDKLAGLQMVTYQWNDTAASVYHNDTTVTNTGFIAQDIEKLFPNLVVTDKNGYKTLDYTTLNLYSLEGVKELNQKVALQQKEIDSLKGIVCADHPASALCAGAAAP